MCSDRASECIDFQKRPTLLQREVMAWQRYIYWTSNCQRPATAAKFVKMSFHKQLTVYRLQLHWDLSLISDLVIQTTSLALLKDKYERRKHHEATKCATANSIGFYKMVESLYFNNLASNTLRIEANSVRSIFRQLKQFKHYDSNNPSVQYYN